MFENIKNMIFGNTNSNSRGGNLLGQMKMNRSSRRCLNYTLVSFEQAKTMIETNQVMLIDVRDPGEHEAMRIKNSINIPVNQIESKIGDIPKEAKIMVYCASGNRSKMAMQTLNSLGYNNIYIWEYASLANFPYKNLIEYS